MTIIQQKSVKSARENYTCNSCMFILNGGSFNEFTKQYKLTFSEKRALIKAKNNNYDIVKGEPYIRQFNKMEGMVYTWKAIPEIHAICIKYDLYSE